MTTDNPALDRLTYLSQCELSAVANYDRALAAIKNEAARTVLAEVKALHEERLKSLTDLVKESGGTLPSGSGLWGWFSKWIEKGVMGLGEKAIVATLEEYEIKSLADFQSNIEPFDETVQKVIVGVFVPAQQTCFEKISALRKSLN